MLKFYLAKLSRHETDGPGHATVCQDKLTKQARPRFQASKAHAGMESTFRPARHNPFGRQGKWNPQPAHSVKL